MYTKLVTAVTQHHLGQCIWLHSDLCASGQDQCALSEMGPHMAKAVTHGSIKQVHLFVQ
jgi:hypothetical protein